ncbi:uncharacterized protein LY79DRAFT_653585 [Colletotrichum navitas]|uniref:Uncharacterized protein n=1 Tax=Colletotrichum navitas TaxID=681940 RepID=A0AAD8UX60_9PEZI|nr:uncharacterized protein LY79DRAFT_653585 [Colletotrichum navitas]KAK1570105.1 hypothetical protein LY79DRAFT_653585 [Colletotrichum navitas]
MAEHAVQRDAVQAARAKQELDAVGSIPEADAQKVLYFICSEDEAVRRKALDFYRGAPKRDVCTQCEKEFDPDKNASDACCYHPGDFELDEDLEVWDGVDDYDWPAEHYERDSEANRQDIPEGFRWSCCDRVGDVKGCETGRHEGTGATTAAATTYGLALEVNRMKAKRLGELGGRVGKESEVHVPGGQASNKRKADGELGDGDASKVKKGAGAH